MPNLLRKFSLENTERRHGARGEGQGIPTRSGMEWEMPLTGGQTPTRWPQHVRLARVGSADGHGSARHEEVSDGDRSSGVR